MALQVTDGSHAPSNDDSGLIDLHALMAEAASQGGARDERAGEGDSGPLSDELTPAPVVRSLDLYPFGAPVEAAPPPPPADPAPSGRNTSLRSWGLLVAALGGVAIVGALSGLFLAESLPARPAARLPIERASAALTEAAAPPPAPAITESSAVPEAKTTVPAAPSAPPAATVAKKPPVHVWRPPPPARKRTPETEKAPAAPTAKPAPVDPCHGDLMCAMKRATEGH